MDFVISLSRTSNKYDKICVIVDYLTKSSHFLPFRTHWLISHLAELFVREVVRLLGVLSSIIFYHDPKFTSHFWQKFQEVMGIELHMSSVYHPQFDGQNERTIQTLEDLLRACCLI